MGPFYFNGFRFFLGTITLLPLLAFYKTRRSPNRFFSLSLHLKAGIITGIFLFLGITFQQVGIGYTTAGKAGFITGFYVVLVPIFGLLLRHRIRKNVWFGALLAIAGLFLLSFRENWEMQKGDLIVFAGAFFWAAHVISVGYFSHKTEAIRFATIQFGFCSLASFVVAGFSESLEIKMIEYSLLPLLYAGVMSIGVGFTLQIIGQKNTPASHAAVILSLEAMFAVFGGWIILDELLSVYEALGCVLMFAGFIVVQVRPKKADFQQT